MCVKPQKWRYCKAELAEAVAAVAEVATGEEAAVVEVDMHTANIMAEAVAAVINAI